MVNIELDDFRQSFVVMKNEFIKFVRGKKVLLYLGLILLVLVLLTTMPYVFGGGLSKNSAELIQLYVYFAPWMVLLSAALFASTSIVSEFEERTALVLFTKPLNKWSIFLGKFAASVAISVLFVLFYYAFTGAVSFAVAGSIESALWKSMGLAMLYTISASGVAMLISSVMNKSSTSTMLAFVVMLLIFPLLSMLMGSSIEVWWMLDQAGNAIHGLLPLTVGGKVIAAMATSEILRAAGVMLVWGALSSIAAYLIFRRRDF